MEKVIVITGGSTGIGKATAKMAIEKGHKVVITGRNMDSLNSTKTEIISENLLVVQSDVTSWEDLQALRQQVLAKFGKIDAVFANAGFTSGANSFYKGEPTPEEWKAMVLTNVYGAAITARTFLPDLVSSKGNLLLTGSVVGRVASPGRLYSSTKWAITGMAESIRKELLETGVRVTLVEPGMVETPFWDGSGATLASVLQPEDIASAVLFALEQPAHVDINEILIRPVGQGI